MIPPLHIQLLGEFRLFIDEQPAEAIHQQRIQALLAYLCLFGHAPHPRTQIASLFWPDSTEKQAHTNLRKLIHLLRQYWPEVDNYLAVDYHSIGWRSDVTVNSDVWEVEQSLALLEQDPQPDSVNDLIRLYRGELLPVCYEEWLLPWRRALHERVVNRLTESLATLEAQLEHATAIRCAEHILRLDPLHEAPYRHLMHLRSLAGDRAGALRVYHECVRLLEQELAVLPSSETQALYQHLLQVEAPPAQHTPELNPLQTPLVGRQQEWKTLLSAFQQMARRGPHLLLIWGEAGIGKSRLVEEFQHWANLRPGSVAYARAYAAEGDLAYAPVTLWLRSVSLQTTLDKLDPLWLGELVRLLPELQRQHPKLPPAGALNEDWQRQRFHEALARALLAAPAPCVLILDDVQWCDMETLLWLRYLLRFAQRAPLLVVGTVRSEEVDAHHPLHQLVHQLQRSAQYSAVEVGPLRAAETALLARQLAHGLSDDWVERLHEETEGNPLFVVEVARARQHGHAGNAGDQSAEALPATVLAVIGARLAQLTPAARRLAQLAAVIGRAFSFEILAAAGETPEGELVQSLDELWQRRIVRENESGYDFSHEKIREVVYGEISRPRRQWYHRRIAQALQTQYAPDLRQIYGKLAAHLERAGELGQAASYWLAAGEDALNSYAPQQALVNFQRGLALALRLSPDAEQQADAFYGLGRARFALDELAEAALAAEQALQRLAAGDRRRPKLLYFLAEIAFARYDVDGCEVYARQARQSAEEQDDQETLCQSLSLLGQVCSSRGQLEQEIDLINEALSRCRDTGNRWREGRTLADLGWLHAQRAEFGEAIAVAKAALAILETTDDRAGVAFAWNVLGRAHGGAGHYVAAFTAFQHGREVAASIDHKFLMAQIPNMFGWLHQQLGDYRRALEFDRQGVELAQAWEKTPAEISAAINVALDLLHLGDAGQALAQLQQVQARIERDAIGFHAWRWRLRLLEGQGLCFLALGQASQARELALACEELALATTSHKYIAVSRALLGRALAELGEVEAGTVQLEDGVKLADSLGYQPLRWQGRAELARYYTALGRKVAADRCWIDAAAIVDGIASELTDPSLRSAFLNASLVRELKGMRVGG